MKANEKTPPTNNNGYISSFPIKNELKSPTNSVEKKNSSTPNNNGSELENKLNERRKIVDDKGKTEENSPSKSNADASYDSINPAPNVYITVESVPIQSNSDAREEVKPTPKKEPSMVLLDSKKKPVIDKVTGSRVFVPYRLHTNKHNKNKNVKRKPIEHKDPVEIVVFFVTPLFLLALVYCLSVVLALYRLSRIPEHFTNPYYYTPYYASTANTFAPLGIRMDIMHSDVIPLEKSSRSASTNNVQIAIGPTFEFAWLQEEPLINPASSVVVDDVGTAFACLGKGAPHTMIAFDYKTGDTKWTVDPSDGEEACGGTPLLLVATGSSQSHANDIRFDPPTQKKQMMLTYHFTSKYLYAHRGDGVVHFKSPVFLEEGDSALGVAYLPARDVLIGVTRRGFLFAFERLTGKLAAQPKKVPCANAPENECMISSVVAVSASESRFYFTAYAKDETDTDQTTDLGALYGVDVVQGEIDSSFRFRIKFFAYAVLGKVGVVGKDVSVSPDGSFLVVGENSKVTLLDGKTFEQFFSTYASNIPSSPESFRFLIVSDEAAEGLSVYFKNQEQVGKLLVTSDKQVTLVWETNSNYAFTLSHGDLKLTPSLNSNMVLTSNGLLIAGDYFTTNRFVLKSFKDLYVNSGIFLLDRSTGLCRYSFVSKNYVSSLGVSMDGGVFATLTNEAWREKHFNYLLSYIVSTQQQGAGGLARFAPRAFEALAKESICDADLRVKNTIAYAKGGWVFTSAKEQNMQPLLADTKQVVMLVWQANAAYRFALEKQARDSAAQSDKAEEPPMGNEGKAVSEQSLVYFNSMFEYLESGFEDADGALTLLNNLADAIHTACGAL